MEIDKDTTIDSELWDRFLRIVRNIYRINESIEDLEYLLDKKITSILSRVITFLKEDKQFNKVINKLEEYYTEYIRDYLRDDFEATVQECPPKDIEELHDYYHSLEWLEDASLNEFIEEFDTLIRDTYMYDDEDLFLIYFVYHYKYYPKNLSLVFYDFRDGLEELLNENSR